MMMMWLHIVKCVTTSRSIVVLVNKVMLVPAHVGWWLCFYASTENHIPGVTFSTAVVSPQFLFICKPLCNPPSCQLLHLCRTLSKSVVYFHASSIPWVFVVLATTFFFFFFCVYGSNRTIRPFWKPTTQNVLLQEKCCIVAQEKNSVESPNSVVMWCLGGMVLWPNLKGYFTLDI